MNFCTVNLYEGDFHIRFYRSAVDAYAEMDRRMRHGVRCEVLERHEWPREVAKEYSALFCASERAIGVPEESESPYIIEGEYA